MYVHALLYKLDRLKLVRYIIKKIVIKKQGQSRHFDNNSNKKKLKLHSLRCKVKKGVVILM